MTLLWTITLAAQPVVASEMAAEQQCLSLAIYWEARGEAREGMTAVGWTILNRAAHDEFPATVCAVVKQGGETPPCQFSWWCDGKSDRPRDADNWQRAQAIAKRLVADPPPDPTDGALFFHSAGIAVPWRIPRQKTASIGNHIFYR